MWRCSSAAIRVAVRETGQELALLQEVEQEVRGRDAERALDDHVVDRHEVDLGLAVVRLAPQAVVGFHERLVEDLAEGVAQQLAGARHVRADRRRVGHHLVLEARVELHVAVLVNELRGEVAALLLVVLCEHEAAELSRDSLLGDHE
jgi:hypothetical protein